MLQIRFLEALLRRCKEDLGLHTAVDTSGFLDDRATDGFLDVVDLFLLDIKSGDPQTYYLVTSADLEPTLRFARRLSGRGNRMWIRFVLVPGLTDAADNVDAVARVRRNPERGRAGRGPAVPPAGRGQMAPRSACPTSWRTCPRPHRPWSLTSSTDSDPTA